MLVVGNVRPGQLVLDIADLAKKHYDMVFRFCARRVGTDRAADVAQETFLTAQRIVRKFRGDSSPSTWLLGIANNECRREIRRGKLPTFQIAFAENLAVDDRDHSAFIDRESLRDAFRRLSEEHREIVIMHELDGLSYEEIANVLEIPLGTVKSRLHHAFANLRKFLTTEEEVSIGIS